MASSDYLIDLKEIPKPKVSDNLGVPDIPTSIISESGSFGESSMDSGVLPTSNIAQTGFILGQYSGVVGIAQPKNGATAAEYESALEAIYQSVPPKYGDMVTLRDSNSGAFDSRWMVFLRDDTAPASATISFSSPESEVSWYAYNLSALGLSAITDAIDQALGQFDNTGTNPRDDDNDEEVMSGGSGAEFEISISNLYDIDSETGIMEIRGTPIISVESGTIEPMEGLTLSISDASFSNGIAPADGSAIFVHVYVKYQLNFSGTRGSRVANTVTDGSIEFYKNTDADGYREGGTFSDLGTEYIHYMYLGTVAICRRGSRRFAKVNQVRSGSIKGIQNFNSISSGTETDDEGNDVADKTKAGLREITLCLGGKPYSTFIITGPLFEI